MEQEYRFGLGDKVKDVVTGYVGIIIGRADHVSGCDTYGVQSETLKDGMPQDSKWFDDPRLELVQAGAIKPLINTRAGRDTGADSVPVATRSTPTR